MSGGKNTIMEHGIQVLYFAFGLNFIFNAIQACVHSIWITLLMGLVFIAGAAFLRAWSKYRSSSKMKREGFIYEFDKKKRGIIFTVGYRSAEDNSIIYPVCQRMKPEFIGFIETADTRKKEVIDQIAEKLSLKDSNFKRVEVDPIDVVEIQKSTSILIDWMKRKGLSRQDILLDLTAGLATMSVASFISADEASVDMQYVFSTVYKDNKPVDDTQKAVLIREYAD